MTNEEAIEWVENYLKRHNTEMKYHYKIALNVAIDALKEQERNRWIPVSERLPEERDWYLAQFKESDNGFMLIPRVADYVGKETKITTKDYWSIIDFEEPEKYIKSLECIAWKPLPEPYKEVN